MWFYKEGAKVGRGERFEMMKDLVAREEARLGRKIRRALLLPPDITRFHSGSGELANMLYHILGPDCHTDVIPTLGQHVPHTPEENRRMFGDIPEERILKHNWRKNCTVLGEIPREFVKTATGGLADWPIPVEINSAVTDGGYDSIINIGQVVPHEVLGFANHNKNYFIGIAGKGMITASHITAALCGIENNLGQLITPLRGCYNYAEQTFMGHIPSVYVQIVKTRSDDGELLTTGLYVGDDVSPYVAAARYARRNTVHMFEKPLKKVVCFMDGSEFRSTWVANKAIYRTRKAIADGGELLILAPGVERFGEQPEVDELIRAYGYKGTPNSLEGYKNDPRMRDLAHAAAHLIHGSSEGRFNITYAPGRLSKEEVNSVGYGYMDYAEAIAKYDPETLKEGFNTVDGEEIYFINSPSLGLWTARDKFKDAFENNMAFCERMIAARPDQAVWRQIREWNLEDARELAL